MCSPLLISIILSIHPEITRGVAKSSIIHRSFQDSCIIIYPIYSNIILYNIISNIFQYHFQNPIYSNDNICIYYIQYIPILFLPGLVFCFHHQILRRRIPKRPLTKAELAQETVALASRGQRLSAKSIEWLVLCRWMVDISIIQYISYNIIYIYIIYIIYIYIIFIYIYIYFVVFGGWFFNGIGWPI